ncbi:MAG: tetratricopeptide repeat protein [Pseudomonadota bacterium]
MLDELGSLPGEMTLADRQRAEGDLVGAVATLERVLLANPGADEARLIHASLLCRLDDPAGARVEIGQLAGHAVADAAWAEVVAACGALPRPVAGVGR